MEAVVTTGAEEDSLLSKTKPELKEIAEKEICMAEPEPKDWKHCGFTSGFTKKKKGLAKADLVSAIKVKRGGGSKGEALAAALDRDVTRRKKYDYREERYGVFEKGEYYYVPKRTLVGTTLSLSPGIIFLYEPDIERGIIGKNVLDMDVNKYQEIVGDEEEINMKEKIRDVTTDEMPEDEPSYDGYYDLRMRIKLPKVIIQRKLSNVKKISPQILENIRYLCRESKDPTTDIQWIELKTLFDRYRNSKSDEGREMRRIILKTRNHLLWFTLLEKVANVVITSVIATKVYNTEYGRRIRDNENMIYKSLPISTYDTICDKGRVSSSPPSLPKSELFEPVPIKPESVPAVPAEPEPVPTEPEEAELEIVEAEEPVPTEPELEIVESEEPEPVPVEPEEAESESVRKLNEQKAKELLDESFIMKIIEDGVVTNDTTTFLRKDENASILTLAYILSKHKNDCGIIDSDDNFDIVYFPETYEFLYPGETVSNFFKMVNLCKKTFVVVPIALKIEKPPQAHSNILVINVKTKTAEIFEPHGGGGIRDKYFKNATEDLEKRMRNQFIKNGYTLSSVKDVCPDTGPQLYETYDRKGIVKLRKKYIRFNDGTGLCLFFTYMFVDLRLTYPDTPSFEINRALINAIQGSSRPDNFRYDMSSFVMKWAKFFEREYIKLIESVLTTIPPEEHKAFLNAVFTSKYIDSPYHKIIRKEVIKIFKKTMECPIKEEDIFKKLGLPLSPTSKPEPLSLPLSPSGPSGPSGYEPGIPTSSGPSSTSFDMPLSPPQIPLSSPLSSTSTSTGSQSSEPSALEEYEEECPGLTEIQKRLTDEERRLRLSHYDRIMKDSPELYARYEKAKEEYYNDIFNSKLEAIYTQLEWDLYKQTKPDEQLMEVVGYPTYENPDFQKIITLKQEFWDYRTKPGGNILSQIHQSDKEKSSKIHFKLQNHQRFISHFLSSMTPYNSMLIFHGVGTGKTCTSIQVAEMYLNETGGQKRAIIITPLAVQPGFRREINDPMKLEEDDPAEQCTGDQYLSMLSPAEIKSGGAFSYIERKINRFIKSRYDMFGYGSFENWFRREIIEKARDENPDDRKKQSKTIRELIEQYFSGRLLIIDEVHNIRDPEYKKRILRYLILIARFSNGAKILLMSATPMYNLANEIIHIVNILRLNEGLPAVPERLVFDITDTDKLLETDEDDTMDGSTILKMAVNGLVSYLRGENPVDFPVRLPPSPDVMDGRNPRPQRDFKNELIDNELPEGSDILPIVRVPIDDKTMMGQAYIDEFEGKLTGNRDITAPSAAVGLIQSAVCVFPNGTSGITGFGECFRELASDAPEGMYQPIRETQDVIDSGTGKLFLHPDRIREYAPKIREILNVCHKSDGISLIFTQNLQGSAIPIGMALELMGYQRVDGKPLLAFSNPRMRPDPIGTGGMTKKEYNESGSSVEVGAGIYAKEWQPYTYTILSGDVKLTKNRERSLRLINSEGNMRGEKVKIIIATEAISEGVNFKNLREVHMTDAYYHISLMDQVVGRAQRYRSHNALPRNERNVSVYVWCVSWSSEHPRYGSETLDETLWRKAEEKSVRIGKITRILKESAVDCHLMKAVNDRSTIEYEEITTMIDSHRNPIEFNYKDQPGSRECDYQTSCAIECTTNIDVSDPTTNTETYRQSEGSSIRSEIKREIKYFMIRNPVSNHTDIIRDVKNIIPGSRRNTILQILTRMIIQEEPIMIPGGGIARLEYKNDGTNEVISITPTEITDGRAPYIDRLGVIPRKPSGVYVPPRKISRILLPESQAQAQQPGDITDVGIGDEAAAIQSLEREELKYDDKALSRDTPVADFMKKFMIAWSDSYSDVKIDSALTLPSTSTAGLKYNTIGTILQPRLRKPETESDLGVLVGYLRRILSDLGISPEIWAAVIAERITPETGETSIPYMSDPEIRKSILITIAKQTANPDDPSVLAEIRHLGSVYRMNGEIIGPYLRDPSIRVKTINSTGNVDNYDIETGLRIEGMTTPVIKRRISKGFHVYLGTITQKLKRGEPMGMLRLFFQDYSTKLYPGYNPNNSTTSLERSLETLYRPGIGLVFEGPKGTKIISDTVLARMMFSGETMYEGSEELSKAGEKAAKNLFSMLMRQPLKIIAEAITRSNGNYRSPIDYKTLIESRAV